MVARPRERLLAVLALGVMVTGSRARQHRALRYDNQVRTLCRRGRRRYGQLQRRYPVRNLSHVQWYLNPTGSVAVCASGVIPTGRRPIREARLQHVGRLRAIIRSRSGGNSIPRPPAFCRRRDCSGSASAGSWSDLVFPGCRDPQLASAGVRRGRVDRLVRFSRCWLYLAIASLVANRQH